MLQLDEKDIAAIAFDRVWRGLRYWVLILIGVYLVILSGVLLISYELIVSGSILGSIGGLSLAFVFYKSFEEVRRTKAKLMIEWQTAKLLERTKSEVH